MRDRLNKIRKKENLVIFVFLFLLLLMHLRIHLVDSSDDGFASKIVSTGNWDVVFANNRLLVNVVCAFVMALPLIVWKILNIAALMILLLKIFQIMRALNSETEEKNDTVLKWGICALFWMLPFQVLSSGAFWVTGSFYYLWGICGAFFVIFPFIKDMQGKQVETAELLTGGVIGLYACNLEQTMAMICFCGGAYLVFKLSEKERIKKCMFLYGVILVIESLPILLLPYNSTRGGLEEIMWYPGYRMLGLFDRVFQCAMYYYDHLVHSLPLILFLISLFTAILAYRTMESMVFRIMALLPLGYFTCALVKLPTMLEDIKGRYLFAFWERFYTVNIGRGTFLSFLCATGIFLLLFLTLIFVLRDKCRKYMVAALYLGAMAGGMMLSFSPTIFASGNRVFFVPDILLLAIAAILGKTVLAEFEIPVFIKQVFSGGALACSVFLALILAHMQSRGVFF